MLHTNRGELQLLFDTFCRVWGAGGQATLTTTTQGGELKANLEIQVGSPCSPRPGGLVLLQLPLPSPLHNAILVLSLSIGVDAVLATEDQQRRLDLEQEQLLTRLPWQLLHPPLLQ